MLGAEVVEQPALGDAGLGGDGLERQRLRAVAPHDRRGGVEQPRGVRSRGPWARRLVGVHQWAPEKLRSTTPAMMSSEAEKLEGAGRLAERDDADGRDQCRAHGGPDGVGEADRELA